MLRKISSDVFRIGKEKRPPIEFSEGLNIVLGSGKSANSIGKSTLLLAIDFCFGGDDYVLKQKNAIDNIIGHHSIEFEFEFNGVRKYFRRTTSEPKFVEVCDEHYNTLKRITNDQFCIGLRRYYCLSGELTFREWVSPFFRIYNRGNYNETKPINAHYRQLESSGITNLLKMFGKYDFDNKLQKQLVDLNEKYIYLKKSPQNRNFQPIANDEELEKAKKQLNELEQELQRIEEYGKKGVTDAKTNELERKAILTQQYRKINRELRKYASKIKAVDDDSQYEKESYAQKYDSLRYFFPNANIKGIEEYENFHKKMASIVNKEAKETNEHYSELIEMLKNQLDSVDKELSEYEEVPTVSITLSKQIVFIRDQIKVLKDRIDTYTGFEATSQEISATEKQLNDSVSSSTGSVASTLNQSMFDFNRQVRTKEPTRSPVIKFNGIKSYAFYTPNDDGTGTRYKALCLLDLSILTSTGLPAIAHDSVIYSNIEDDTINDLLKLYESKKNKQLFVAIADSNKFNAYESNIVLKHKVIELGRKENALYGFQFNADKRQ